MNTFRPNPNLEHLLAIATRLTPLLDEIAFVGGCVTELLLTDPAAAPVRPTLDVDAIIAISSYAELVHVEKRLREMGFSQPQTEGSPVCRWVIENLILDLMPTDSSILGFSNRWYRAALENSIRMKNRRLRHTNRDCSVLSRDEAGRLSWTRKERLPHEPRPGGHCDCHRWTIRGR